MALTLDARNIAGGGVTLFGDGLSLFANNITLISEGIQLTPVNAATLGLSTVLNLSGTTVTAGASVGTVIGNFSVSNGSTRPYTFTLTSNPGGLFSVGGSTLAVAAALSAGTDPITAKASDTGTSVVTGSFNITVSSSAPSSAAMQFNIASNSMYIPILGGLG